MDDHNITSNFTEYSWEKIETSFTHLHDYTDYTFKLTLWALIPKNGQTHKWLDMVYFMIILAKRGR